MFCNNICKTIQTETRGAVLATHVSVNFNLCVKAFITIFFRSYFQSYFRLIMYPRLLSGPSLIFIHDVIKMIEST